MARHVVVLAPMPLEMDAITAAFDLHPDGPESGAHWSGTLGQSDVTAVHIGMGPPLTRLALEQLFDESGPGFRPIDHVMNAGICGGLDPSLEVGTIINPETIVEHSTGVAYAHQPPGNAPCRGTLITTEKATLDHDRSRRFFEEGIIAVDMESAAVADFCQERGVPWSIYRCIGDRWFDGLLDERIIAATNPDGSGDMDEIARLIESDPQIKANLDRLGRETFQAARLAAEAAARGCLALDSL
jgi:adenosylhomocysteine nucleosidase